MSVPPSSPPSSPASPSPPGAPLPPTWAARVERNRRVAIPRLFERLAAHGVVDNFRPGTAHRGFWFVDSDLYKWMEAAAWAGGGAELEATVELVLGAQAPDGYLNTYFGTEGKPGRWHDPTWSHELYCAGHLMQAAVARHQALGADDLLDAAERLADRIAADVPDGWRDHHPVIEMALVELARATGAARHLDLAAELADRAPWRAMDRLWGHAVCALYFASGLTELAIETGDAERRAAVERWYDALLGESVYLTGAVGGRWVAEAMGEPYELPQARSYTEACAAVAGVQWHERMHRLNGDPRAVEWRRITLENALAAAVSPEGDEWFYATPHATSAAPEQHPWIGDRLPAEIAGPLPLRRAPWRDVTCCPPNVTRLLAWLPHAPLPVVGPRADAEPEWVEASHRVESLRGAVALVRDDVVHCFEQIDQPEGVDVRDIAVDVDAPVTEVAVAGLDEPGLAVSGYVLSADALYRPTTRGRAVSLVAIPFRCFARRGATPMITWVPRAPV